MSQGIYNNSINPPQIVVKVKYSLGEKWAVGGISLAFIVGVISLVGAGLAFYGIARGIHPSFLGPIPLDKLAFGLTGGSGLILIGLGGVALLKWREKQSKQVFKNHKDALLGYSDLFSSTTPHEIVYNYKTRYVIAEKKVISKQDPHLSETTQDAVKKSAYIFEIYTNRAQAQEALTMRSIFNPTVDTQFCD